MEEKEIKRRYWVDGGRWDSGTENNEELKKKYEKIEERLRNLGFWAQINLDIAAVDFLVFKTWNKEEAIRTAREARQVVGEELEEFKKELNVDYLVESIRISVQPVCPACEELGKFSDEYCSKCGVKLLPRDEIEC